MPESMPQPNLPLTGSTALPPTGLLCELMEHPERTLIRTPHPRFGWIVNDRAPGASQAAFQILVASSLDLLARGQGDLWDSGAPDFSRCWTTQPASLHVRYAGAPLAPRATYHWKVRTWNSKNQPSYFSEPQTFHTGELDPTYQTARYPVAAHEIAPRAIVQTAPDTTFIDFGRAAFGTLKLTLSNPAAATPITIHLGEVADGPQAIRRDPGGSRRYRAIPLQLQPGTRTYTLAIPPDERNTGPAAIRMPANIGEVMPFRYCEISGYRGPIARDAVRQVAAFYPFNDQAARFVSSNRVLNDVWEFCKYSIKATSFCGVYVDGDRERIPYEADAYINQLGHYACDREFTLARGTHEYLLAHATQPTEWLIHSIFSAWADYLYTGDSASLQQHYPDLQLRTLPGHARADGLLSGTSNRVLDRELESLRLNAISERKLFDICDWPQGERDGFDFQPVNTIVNAFHYRSLELMTGIAEAVGQPADAGLFRRRADQVRAAFQANLIDRSRGLVMDGENSKHASLHANMFALAFGLVPDALRPSVTAFIKSKGMACSVYGAQYLLEALYEAGEADYALALLTSTAERSWGHMLYDAGSTITLEAWDDRFKPNQDWNHAWGAAPANIIPRRLMGVRPLEPGFGKILIQPQPGSLSFAEMTCPTIRGPVTVRFQNQPGRAFFLDLSLPANTTARVVLPQFDDPDPTALLDGQAVCGLRENAGVVIDPVGSGTHTLARLAHPVRPRPPRLAKRRPTKRR